MSLNTIAVLEPGYADYNTEMSILEGLNANVVPIKEGDDAISALITLDPVAIMVRERAVTVAEMDCCPRLKVIVRYGVGVDTIDLPSASARKIFVANIPDYGAENEVSEHALALYLAVQRRIPWRDREVRSGIWGVGQSALIPDRSNGILGLIGCGRIGLEAARKFRAIGFNEILVFDPFLRAETASAEHLSRVELDELCSRADVISLHAPLTEDTRHILDRKRIALMKPTSIVVNVSRGGLVDEAALAAALTEGRILGAGIDVFECEPVSLENPLLSSPGTVISDHNAWYSERAVELLQNNAAQEIYRVLMGGQPQNWVNQW